MLDSFPTLATYVHDLDPVIFSISEKIKLRWYGLSYVAGFLAAFLILGRLARRNLYVVTEEKVADVITYAAVFGVFLGGRLGYVIFYMIPREGIGAVLNDPLSIVRVWDGGMSSHGGILGIMFFLLFYAWKNKVNWAALGDGMVVVAPLGVFFGRVANFINGELYGTYTAASNWYAVKFPKALFDPAANQDHLESALFEAATVDPDGVGQIVSDYSIGKGDFTVSRAVFENQIEPIARENPAVLEALGNHIPARHPSQLYEGILEGLVLFLLLFWMRRSFTKMWHGVLTGTFFVLYAIFRILVENVRQPDHSLILGVTKGQFYSYFMIAIGLGFFAYAWKTRKSFD